LIDYFLIAKIDSVYGNKGFVRITSFSDFPDRFFKLRKVYIDFFGNKKEFVVEDVKRVKNFFIIKFINFDSENDVRILLDKEIFISSEDSVNLPADHFFIHDLIGSKVLRNNVEFGKIVDVLTLPANDVYVVHDMQNREILIPAVKEFILSFNPAEKILILNPDKDLYEDDEI